MPPVQPKDGSTTFTVLVTWVAALPATSLILYVIT